MDESDKKLKFSPIRKELHSDAHHALFTIAWVLDIDIEKQVKVSTEHLHTSEQNDKGEFLQKPFTKIVLDTHGMKYPHFVFTELKETLEKGGLKPIIPSGAEKALQDHGTVTLRLEENNETSKKLRVLAESLKPEKFAADRVKHEAKAALDHQKFLVKAEKYGAIHSPVQEEPDKVPAMPDKAEVAREIVAESPNLQNVLKGIADHTGDQARMIASLYHALEFDVSPEYVWYDPAVKPLADIRKELDYYRRHYPEFPEEVRHAVLRELWDIAQQQGVQEEVRAMARADEQDNVPIELTQRVQKPTSEFPPAEAGSEIRSIGKPEKERKSSPDATR